MESCVSVETGLVLTPHRCRGGPELEGAWVPCFHRRAMCRNIKTLFNFDPPATDEEIEAASLQFVRKLSGFTKPSQANEEAFDRAVEETTEVAKRLLDSLVTKAPPKDREIEAEKARERSRRRFAR